MKSKKVEIILLTIVLFIAVAANKAPLSFDQKGGKDAFWYPPIYPKSSGLYDGWVLESGETTNVGGTINATGTAINLGDDASRKQYVAILHFNTASYSIPSTAVIFKAVLRLRRQTFVGSNPFLTFGPLYVDMRKPSFGTVALAASDFQTLAGRSSIATFGTTPTLGWYKAVLNASGRAYLNKNGITQFRLHFKLDDNGNKLADYAMFYSGNATASLRPMLEIQYYVPEP